MLVVGLVYTSGRELQDSHDFGMDFGLSNQLSDTPSIRQADDIEGGWASKWLQLSYNLH